MRRRLPAPLAVAMVLLGTHALSGQWSLSAADFMEFQGTWVLELARSESRSTERRVITMAPEWLRVEVQRAADDHPFALIYKFDGSETMTAFGKGSATSRLRREGADLITETVYVVNDQPVTVTERLRITPDGTEMTAETMLRVEHGYQGVKSPLESSAPNLVKARMVFIKEQ